MPKIIIVGVVNKVFERKRQNQLFEHQFIRIIEQGTKNVFDVQFYNNKINQIKENGIKEGQKVVVEAYLNGKHWLSDQTGKEGVFLKINGQEINAFNHREPEPKIAK